MKKRIKKIFNNLEKNVDAILIKNGILPYIDENFFYVTGLEQGVFEDSLAILFPSGDVDLIVPELDGESAKKAKVHLHVFKKKEEIDTLLNKRLSFLKTVGINSERITYKEFWNLRERYTNLVFVDVSEALAKTRIIKDDLELSLLKKSCAIADKVMKQIPTFVQEGRHEYEIAAEIDYLMMKNGADKPAFETISSFGKNTAEPHYSHGNAKLTQGDFALFDFGACFRKYHSDMTRTFICGKANEKQQEMHTTVQEAQSIGFDSIQSGVKAKDVHQAVASSIDSTKFKGRFIHSTGHALGLAVHDGPGFRPESTLTLQENMVFTVEPGVYLPGYGGVRIEDVIRVKKEGIELLTGSSRELREL